MKLTDAIRKRINYYLSNNNMTVWQLYKATGIPKSTLCAIINGTSKIPRNDTLLHICEGFGITLREFYDDELFENVEQD